MDRDPGDCGSGQAEAAERRLCQLPDKVSGVLLFLPSNAGGRERRTWINYEASLWLQLGQTIQGQERRVNVLFMK